MIMQSQQTFAHKLSIVLQNAKRASGPAWNKERWLAAVNEFVNLERPLVARTKRKTPLIRMSEEELIAEFSSDETYAGIDVPREAGKCRAWCKTNNKRFTARRFLNWLNKADRTLAHYGADSATRKAAITERTNTPPANWQAFMRTKQAAWKAEDGNEHYDPPGFTALQNDDFFSMPQSWREECWKNEGQLT